MGVDLVPLLELHPSAVKPVPLTVPSVGMPSRVPGVQSMVGSSAMTAPARPPQAVLTLSTYWISRARSAASRASGAGMVTAGVDAASARALSRSSSKRAAATPDALGIRYAGMTGRTCPRARRSNALHSDVDRIRHGGTGGMDQKPQDSSERVLPVSCASPVKRS